VPKIIDELLFEQAQNKRENNGKQSGNLKHEYLMRGKIKCGCCGLKYSSFSTTTKQTNKNGETKSWTFKRYRCNGTVMRSYGEDTRKCHVPLLNVDDFDARIWEEYIEEIAKSKDLYKKYGTDQNNEKELIIKKAFFDKQLIQKEKERERIKTMFKHGVIEEDEMLNDIKTLNDDITKIKVNIDDISIALINEKEQSNKADFMNSISDEIDKIMNKKIKTFEDKRKVVDLFIKEIIVRYDEEGNIITDIHTVFDDNLLYELSKQHQGDMNTNHRVNINGEILINVEREVGKKTVYDIMDKNFTVY
jgi:site-specific DNA recombinase